MSENDGRLLGIALEGRADGSNGFSSTGDASAETPLAFAAASRRAASIGVRSGGGWNGDREIDEQTNFPAWDGSRVDYDWTVSALLG